MRVLSRLLAIVLVAGSVASLHAAPLDNPDYAQFEKIFNEWTAAFNEKNIKKTCALFSKEVTADYQGAPQKNYESICKNFTTLFKKRDEKYQYQFTLHRVYHANDLAVARITWYLTISKKDQIVSTLQDESIDVFIEEKPGDWKIVNFVGFPTTKE